jgi:hypothetical protein
MLVQEVTPAVTLAATKEFGDESSIGVVSFGRC